MKMYKLLESDGTGYFNLHTKDLTRQEAEQMRDEYAKDFPDTDWIIMPHDEYDDKPEREYRNSRYDADGWEDFFPDRDY